MPFVSCGGRWGYLQNDRERNMEDLQLIELYFARDEQAIRETAAKYGKLCFQIAFHITGSAVDSEECVNDTYLGAWNAIPPARPDNFKAFLCKIARNLSLKRAAYNHAEKRSEGALISFAELEEVLPEPCSPRCG